jgi:hypothetical protein
MPLRSASWVRLERVDEALAAPRMPAEGQKSSCAEGEGGEGDGGGGDGDGGEGLRELRHAGGSEACVCIDVWY